MQHSEFAWVVLMIIAVVAFLLARLGSRPDTTRRLVDPDQEAQWRQRLLSELYLVAGGDVGASIRKGTLRGRLGWTRQRMDRVCRFLADAGLIEQLNPAASDAISDQLSARLVFGLPIRLTAPGVRVVEKADDQPDLLKYVTNVTAVSFNAPVTNTSVQAGMNASQQHHYFTSDRFRSEDELHRLVLAFRDALAHLDERSRKIVNAHLATIEAQRRSPRPDRGIIDQAIQSLRSIAEGVTGNAVFLGLVAMCNQLLR